MRVHSSRVMRASTLEGVKKQYAYIKRSKSYENIGKFTTVVAAVFAVLGTFSFHVSKSFCMPIMYRISIIVLVTSPILLLIGFIYTIKSGNNWEKAQKLGET